LVFSRSSPQKLGQNTFFDVILRNSRSDFVTRDDFINLRPKALKFA